MSLSPISALQQSRYLPNLPPSTVTFSNFEPTNSMSPPSTQNASPAKNGPTDEQSPSSKDKEENQQPAWADMKTKAGKDRKRLPLACIACRRKKIRCSGEKPACKHCLKSRIPCVYKITTRKAAPRTDYMAMLDKRLKRMEDRVVKIIPKDHVPDVTRAVVKPDIAQHAQKSNASKKRSASEAFTSDLSKWANSTPHDQDPTAKVPARRKNTTEENSILTEGLEFLPPREIQQHLAEVYFDHVYGQSYPLLHKPSFMRRLEAGTIPPVLVLAVCAISARFSSHPAVQTEPVFLRGEPWAKPALDIALKRFDTPNITILIVYILLGTHEFATCQGGRSWMLGGMAHRMAYALQLHMDLDFDAQNQQQGHTDELSFTDREIRRRTMWACFMMDRFNSSGTQRPMFASEDYMHLQLPIREDLYLNDMPGLTETLHSSTAHPTSTSFGQLRDAKSNMGVAAFTVRIIALWGRLVQYLNLGGREKEEFPMWSSKSTHRKLCDELVEFRNSLPHGLTYSEDNLSNHNSYNLANQFLYLHIAYNHCILFLNRFAIPTTAKTAIPKDIPAQFLHNATSQAIEAAGEISKLVSKAHRYRVTAPYAGYCAVSSSAVHIYNIFSSKNPALVKSSREYLGANITFLNKMKQYWGFFQFLTETIKDLYRQHADGNASLNNRSKSMWQYGDWYDRYPHGVSKTDLDEPHIEAKREEGADAVLSQKSDLQSVDQFFESLSPTSKATHRAKLQNRASTRSRKKLQSPANENKPTVQPRTDVQMDQLYSQNYDTVDIPSSPFGPLESYDRSPMNPRLSAPLGNESQHNPSPLPSPFNPSPHFEPLQQSSFMPQLDRQMVMASYNGFDPVNMQDMVNFWDVDLATAGGGDSLTESSNAWFTPFNINPPIQDFMGPGDMEFPGMSAGQTNLWLSSLQDQNDSPNFGL